MPITSSTFSPTTGIRLKPLRRASASAWRTVLSRSMKTMSVRGVMVPRTDMVFIERDKTVRQALALALRSGFSRIPVVGENVDDVIGIVYLKDLVRRSQETPPVEQVDECTTRLTARFPVDEVAAMYDVELDSDDVETVGGLLASALGRVPIPGATVTLRGLTFTAESATGRRNQIG